MEENDTTVNGAMESLIRASKLEPHMATSLMNDAAYGYDVAKNLIQMGEVLFAHGDLEVREAECEIALTEEDANGKREGERIQKALKIIHAQRKKGLKILKNIK